MIESIGWSQSQLMMPKVLVLEDDKPVAQMVADWLRREHYVVDVTHDGLEAMDFLKESTYDLLILDLSVPGKDGIEVCNLYRRNGGHSPILMLTGRDRIDQRVLGLDAGADDYLTKPFDLRELASRVKALLRRPPMATTRVMTLGDIELDPDSHSVRKGGIEVELFPKEYAILELLMRNPNQVFSPETLLSRLWATDDNATIDALRQTILRLRRKLEQEGDKPLIRTIRGVGYRIET